MTSANATTRSAFASIPRSNFGSKRNGSIPRSDFGGIQGGPNPGRLGQPEDVPLDVNQSESDDEPEDPEEIKREQEQLEKATKIKDTPGLKQAVKFANIWEKAQEKEIDQPKRIEI